MEKESTYLNWRKHNTNSKEKELHSTFAATVYSRGKNKNGGISLEFMEEFGKKITFHLNEIETKVLFMNIDRFYHGKEVNREDYGLSKI